VVVSSSSKVEENELTEFISQTLRAIGVGITSSGIAQPRGLGGSDSFRMPREVCFDVAITATHSKEGGGGIKLKVLGSGLDVQGKGGTQNQTVSRVQFTVPWEYEGPFDRLAGPTKSQKSYDRNDELKELTND
jgi:hypothetical protein